MPNTQRDTTVSQDVPREKVEQLADSFRKLVSLKAEQSHTQARLIRWCVWALRTKPEETVAYRRAEGFTASGAARRQHLDDQAKALLHLEWLATQLENVRSPDSDLSKENDDVSGCQIPS